MLKQGQAGLRKLSYVFAICLLCAAICIPRMLSLEAHWSSDETLWLQRSQQFFTALQKRDFANTFPAYHPGVTTMWLAGSALWRDYGKKLYAAPHLPDLKFLVPERLAHARLPVAFTTGVTILLAGLLLQTLLGNTIALIGILFLALDPFFLAESRRLHNDALATGFLLLTLLCWLHYLEAEYPRRRNLILSGISFGLACLSKSLAGAFLLFLPLLLALYVKQRSLSAWRLLWATLLWCASMLLTVLALWPYLWALRLGKIPLFPQLVAGAVAIAIAAAQQHEKESSITLSRQMVGGLILASLVLLGVAVLFLGATHRVLKGIYWALTTPHEVPQLFLGQVNHDPGIFYYPVHWIVWSATLTLPLIVFAGWRLWRQRRIHPRIFRIGLILMLFGVFYLLLLTLVAKKFARYLVISFPAWDILAAIGLAELIRFLRTTRIAKLSIVYPILVVVLLVQFVPVLCLHPHYRAYYHPLLTGNWLENNISMGGGIGLDMAAKYLNEKPNATQMTVRVTGYGGFFMRYFIGRAYTNYDVFSPWWPDYDVVYIRDKQVGRQLKPLPRKLEHVICINGINYVWIYKVLRPSLSKLK